NVNTFLISVQEHTRTILRINLLPIYYSILTQGNCIDVLNIFIRTRNTELLLKVCYFNLLSSLLREFLIPFISRIFIYNNLNRILGILGLVLSISLCNLCINQYTFNYTNITFLFCHFYFLLKCLHICKLPLGTLS